MAGKLLEKYVKSGDKVEIRKNGKMKTVYYCQVYDVVSQDRIEITMPVENSKIVLLPVGAEYDLHFYSANGLYQCNAKVVDRGKRKTTFLLVMELTSNLRKDQRREFYRFSCALEMSSRALDSEEVEKLEKDGMLDNVLAEEGILKQSIIVDISGGGLRFISDHAYDEESIILCNYQLDLGKEIREYEVLGKVLSVKESEKRPGLYEHRVQYIDIDDEAREEIIQFIFETERKNRRKN